MYERIGGEIKRFALPSIYNYLYAVKALLNARDYADFKDWRFAEYSARRSRQITLGDVDKQFLFEQFFFAYKLMNNLEYISGKSRDEQVPLIQLAGMAFYYAAYSFANCYLFVRNAPPPPTHAGTVRIFNQFCDILAFPFNATGRFRDGAHRTNEFDVINGISEFSSGFTYDSQALKRGSLDVFDYKSAVLSYLKGTQVWHWDAHPLKKEALRKAGCTNFRTMAAKIIRDNNFNSLPDVNFLTCLYRIRGKVNYRDSLFSLYDLEEDRQYNVLEKAERLIGVMLEILKYFSLDIEAYFKARLGPNNFHKNMIEDMIEKTDGYNLNYPNFQKNIFYSA
ncbi:MAG: hypothetical protein JSV30_02975 [Candidatus Omnitrophota bacterium]|nr:MAG: hypothetical protein JSV30_02975 [Candidatus Omnitrophota bacterium]